VNNVLFARTTAMIAPRAIFFSEGRAAFFAINQSASTSLASFLQIETCTPDRSKKNSEALASVYFSCEVWRRMDKTMGKTVVMILIIEKNRVLYDKADKDYLLRLF